MSKPIVKIENAIKHIAEHITSMNSGNHYNHLNELLSAITDLSRTMYIDKNKRQLHCQAWLGNDPWCWTNNPAFEQVEDQDADSCLVEYPDQSRVEIKVLY